MDVFAGILQRTLHVALYASFSSSVDMSDQAAQAMEGRAGALYGQVMATAAFINPELIAIGEKTIHQWIEQAPEIAYLAHFVQNLFRQQAHVRSAEVEEVLGMVREPFGAISMVNTLLTDADMKFAPYVNSAGKQTPLHQSNIDVTKVSADREERRTGWTHYADEYLAHKNSLAANLVTKVKATVFEARVRRYKSALEMALSSDNIPVEVYNNLIATFRQNLPTWHKYWAVRKRALQVETLYPYDIWAPLTTREIVTPYDQAVSEICEGLAPLTPEYVDPMRRGLLEQRWVDVYPNENKRGGMFSYGVKGTHPFIFHSYTDDLESLSTLAHELGHSMHSYFSGTTQPLVYADYSMFCAETASNFNQAMVRAHLLAKEPDRDVQLHIIQEAMSNFHRYLFIMPTLARFELELYTRVEKGEMPTADMLNNLMADLFEEGYGGHMSIDRERVGITWAEFPHLYSPFYVFNYATGISAANALARKVLDDGPRAAQNYLAFLKAGSSIYPVDALRLAGADMTTPEPVNKAFEILSAMIDRLDKLFPA
jgi:oligoendopeptidase F